MSERAPEPRRLRWGILTLLAGVVLPSISILVETTTHICDEIFFDPIPTLWHVLLVIFVPLAHLQVWLAVIKGQTDRGVLLGAANALAIGISLFYTIVYLPLLPLSFVALIYMGLGLLPMAPIFALISGLVLRRQLKRITPNGFTVRMAGLATGVGLALVTIAVIEIPSTVTRIGLQMAISDTVTQRDRGIRWLRAVGNMDYLLRACYERSGRATDVIGFLFSLNNPATPEEARKIFYRVTGETFNTRVPPKRIGGRFVPQDTFDFDPDLGGEMIAGRVKGLSLGASRIDGSVDADAGLAYVEWTLLFKNSSASQQEARAQVQLPPGGVVSRLTLWVNGEEREAAFAGRGQTRQAYQQVVSRRRDPVLVTTAGRDRVLVQCFPVPPNGGEMRIRFGITAPLTLADLMSGSLKLPYFQDRNFRIPAETTHAVWVESGKPLKAEGEGLSVEQPKASLYAARGTLKDTELSDAKTYIRSSRPDGVTESWTRDSLKGEGQIIRQVIAEKENPALSRIVLVVDTSRGMGPWLPEVTAALKTLPPDTEVKLLLAGGNGMHDENADSMFAIGKPVEVAERLREAAFGGGADNVSALIKGWEIADKDQGSVMVWVHGPQPLLLRPVEDLRQRWERRPDSAKLYTVQTENGPDLVEEKLDGVNAIMVIPRMGRLQADLENLFAQLSGRTKSLGFVRVSEKPEKVSLDGGAKETSSHLARLWANDEVLRLLADHGKDRSEEAIQLAARYQIVTPVSGAVVLETQEQYNRAGLQPVDPGSVPTIPEPGMVLLLLVVAAIFLFMLYRLRPLRRGTA